MFSDSNVPGCFGILHCGIARSVRGCVLGSSCGTDRLQSKLLLVIEETSGSVSLNGERRPCPEKIADGKSNAEKSGDAISLVVQSFMPPGFQLKLLPSDTPLDHGISPTAGFGSNRSNQPV